MINKEDKTCYTNTTDTLRKRQRRFLSLTGQSIWEYSLLFTIVVASLIAMQIYAKRAVQGNLRLSNDNLGEQKYAPRQTTSTIKSTVNIAAQETLTIDRSGVTTTRNRVNSIQDTTRTINEQVVRE